MASLPQLTLAVILFGHTSSQNVRRSHHVTGCAKVADLDISVDVCRSLYGKNSREIHRNGRSHCGMSINSMRRDVELFLKCSVFKTGSYQAKQQASQGEHREHWVLYGPRCDEAANATKLLAPWSPASDRDDYCLSTHQESKVKYKAMIGNGFFGAEMEVMGGDLFIAGVYNGNDEHSHRARVPNPLNVAPEGAFGNGGATLDLQRATYIRRSNIPADAQQWVCHKLFGDENAEWCRTVGHAFGYQLKYGTGWCGGCDCCKKLLQPRPAIFIEQRFYAHRSIPSLMVMEYNATWESGLLQGPKVTLAFEIDPIKPESFSDFYSTLSVSRIGNTQVLVWKGTIRENEDPSAIVKLGVAAMIPRIVEVEQGKTYTMIASFHSSLRPEQSVPFSESLAEDDVSSFLANQSDDPDYGAKLRRTHEVAWSELWQHGLEVAGRPDVSQVIRSSMYYILSSIRKDQPYSISAGGLASNAYRGHVFWDAETWVFPAVLAWYPDLAESLIQYRWDRIHQACVEALRNYNKGAKFPWESAATGVEVTGWRPARRAVHISGDIALAARNFYYQTRQRDWLSKIGFPLVRNVAEFYASVAQRDESGAYHIRNVLPPDEFANHKGVDDSVFTNSVAKAVLMFAIEAAHILGVSVKSNTSSNGADIELWRNVAQGLVLLFDEDKQRHPEFLGYHWGTKVKQADTTLLSYPLGMSLDKDVLNNDLEYYARVTSDRRGPAMTWSMNAISYLDLKEKRRAAASFERSLENVKLPFNIWLEHPGGGVQNFMAGAGGFLQSALFGYGGLRLHEHHMTFAPVLVANATSMTLRGMQYLGRSFCIYWNTSSYVSFRLTEGGPLQVTDDNGVSHSLLSELTLEGLTFNISGYNRTQKVNGCQNHVLTETGSSAAVSSVAWSLRHEEEELRSVARAHAETNSNSAESSFPQRMLDLLLNHFGVLLALGVIGLVLKQNYAWFFCQPQHRESYNVVPHEGTSSESHPLAENSGEEVRNASVLSMSREITEGAFASDSRVRADSSEPGSQRIRENSDLGTQRKRANSSEIGSAGGSQLGSYIGSAGGSQLGSEPGSVVDVPAAGTQELALVREVTNGLEKPWLFPRSSEVLPLSERPLRDGRSPKSGAVRTMMTAAASPQQGFDKLAEYDG